MFAATKLPHMATDYHPLPPPHFLPRSGCRCPSPLNAIRYYVTFTFTAILRNHFAIITMTPVAPFDARSSSCLHTDGSLEIVTFTSPCANATQHLAVASTPLLPLLATTNFDPSMMSEFSFFFSLLRSVRHRRVQLFI